MLATWPHDWRRPHDKLRCLTDGAPPPPTPKAAFVLASQANTTDKPDNADPAKQLMDAPQSPTFLRTIRLAHPTDLAGFRTAARVLAQAGVAPADVHWSVAATARSGAQPGPGVADLFDTEAMADAVVEASPHPAAEAHATADTPGAFDNWPHDTDSPPGLAGLVPTHPAPAVPRSFVQDCERLVLHSDPARFALMYRLLWRHTHDSGLRHDALDLDRQLARHMVHAVSRDMHKMRAFVRFRQVQDDTGIALHVAWFEPDHHIVQANAGFFARRFAGMRWAILTPQCSLRWDGKVLDVGPGARRSDAPPPDAGEALWLTYYRHIFNPARLKLDMMRKEMPRRYWHNLPEAELIGELAQTALQRSRDMVAAEPTTPRRRIVPVVQTARVQARAETESDGADPREALKSMYAQAQRCRACAIGACATQAVPGAGPLGVQRMLVGEQPGDQEDLRGQPFVGPAGQLLDHALTQLAWHRDALYLTNAVKHFKYEPRGKIRLHKRPTVAEMQACSPFLDQEIALVQPRTLLALGATAAHALLGRAVKLEEVRGRWHEGVHRLPVLVAWHPSALLRAPEADQPRLFAHWLTDLRAALPSITSVLHRAT